jgi:hypothetical protein
MVSRINEDLTVKEIIIEPIRATETTETKSLLISEPTTIAEMKSLQIKKVEHIRENKTNKEKKEQKEKKEKQREEDRQIGAFHKEFFGEDDFSASK